MYSEIPTFQNVLVTLFYTRYVESVNLFFRSSCKRAFRKFRIVESSLIHDHIDLREMHNHNKLDKQFASRYFRWEVLSEEPLFFRGKFMQSLCSRDKTRIKGVDTWSRHNFPLRRTCNMA